MKIGRHIEFFKTRNKNLSLDSKIELGDSVMKIDLCRRQLRRLTRLFGIVLTTLWAVMGCTDESMEPIELATKIEASALVTASDGCGGVYKEAVAFIPFSVAAPNCAQTFEVKGQKLRSDFLFGSSASGRLRNFCHVELIEGSEWPALEDILNAEVFQGVTRIGPDFLGVIAQGDLVDAYWSTQRAKFREAIGAVDVSSLPPPGAQPVIALVDGAPSDTGVGWSQSYPFSPDHALTLTRIAEEYLCEDGNPHGHCFGRVISSQALKNDHKLNPGRSHGSLGDLARAIYAPSTTHPGGILNISLAWSHPCMGGDKGSIDAGERVAAAAVYEALRYARCQGTAIFAAAGNELGTPGSLYESGLLFPAAWNRYWSPNSRDCLTDFGIDPKILNEEVSLVTSVGAVNLDSEPLALSRSGGEPPLVAPAEGATAGVSLKKNEQPTLVLAGSSVAALVASAQTALLSSVLNQLPIDIEGNLYSISVPLGRFSSSDPAIEVRRLELLEALSLSSVSAAPAEDVVFESPPPEFESLPSLVEPVLYTCSGLSVWADATIDDPCFKLGIPSMDEVPVTHPQPEPVGCPSCRVKFSILASVKGKETASISTARSSLKVARSLASKTTSTMVPTLNLELEPSAPAGVSPQLIYLELNEVGTRHLIRLPNVKTSRFPQLLRIELPTSMSTIVPVSSRVILWDPLRNATSASEVVMW